MSIFFFNDTATTEIYTLSLHDALPISRSGVHHRPGVGAVFDSGLQRAPARRSEEHTSELQSQSNLVCRLLLEKKKNPCDWPADLLAQAHSQSRAPSFCSPELTLRRAQG